MLRTRLASLALVAGLSLTSGCMSWPRPWGCGCCPPTGGCGGCCDGAVASYSGVGGVVGTPCCNNHGAPGAHEGPIAPAPDAGPLLGAMPLPSTPNGALAPSPNPRLVPFPQAPVTPYTPSH
jgi:hypothetical protein